MAMSKSAARLAQHKRAASGECTRGIDEPGCAFGMVTRKGLDDLSKNFERLEVKINGIVFGVIVTVAVEVWKALR